MYIIPKINAMNSFAYTIPLPGQVLPARQNADPEIPNPGPTQDRLAFMRWLQAATQNHAFQQNEIRAIDYLYQFEHSWKVNYESGRMKGPTGKVGDPDAVPLQPPAAMVVIVTAGLGFDIQPSGKETTFEDDGETVKEFGTPFTPVCLIPDYKRIPPPQH
jgi:hypothetical protein